MNREQLIAAGFVPTARDRQQGESLCKTLRVDQMPYVKAHMVATGEFLDHEVAVTEVTPDGNVVLTVPTSDYVESYPLDSEEGRGLLKDALG